MQSVASKNHDEFQDKQLDLLLLVRLFVGLACIGVQVLSAHGATRPLADPALGLLLFACALSVVYFAVARRAVRPGSVTFVVMFADVLLITSLIYLTGGNQSNYSYLYFALIVAASILVSERASLLFASSSTVCLSLVTLAHFMASHYQWALPFTRSEAVSRASHNVPFMLGYLLAQGVALHLVALLSGSLARRIARLSSLTDSVLKYMAGGVIVADLTGRLQYLNDPARSMLGFGEREDLIGRNVNDVFRRDADASLKTTLLRCEQVERELVFPRKAGDLYVEVKTRLLKDLQGSEIGIMALLSDLTEKRLRKEAERQAQTLAGIEEMAAGIAHEIRNPLASIRGSVQELSKAQWLEEDHQTLIDITLKESDRLDRIITEFLRFTRMRPTEPEPCDLAGILEDVVTLIRNRAGNNGALRVEGRYPEPLPCTGDREQIKQLLLNLALNGVDAMSHGGCLTLEAERKSSSASNFPESRDRRVGNLGGVLIRVSDMGCGIAKEESDKIFTPFYTTKKTGTGMGLSIVQKIVTAHGGTVHAHNNVSGGATFSVWIPDRRTPAAEDGQEPAHKQSDHEANKPGSGENGLAARVEKQQAHQRGTTAR